MSYNKILITKNKQPKLLKYPTKSKIKTSLNNKNKQVLHLFVWYSNKLKWESNLTGDTSHEFLIGEEGKMKNKRKEPIMENDSWSSIPAKFLLHAQDQVKIICPFMKGEPKILPNLHYPRSYLNQLKLLWNPICHKMCSGVR